jgi:hypothetical protein
MELQLHVYDDRWFKQHSADLLSDLEQGLLQKKALKDWLLVLALALPFLRWGTALALWYTLIKAAENDIFGLGHERLQVDVCNAVGNFYLLFSKIDDAHNAFITALLVSAEIYPVYIKGYLEALIGLLWLQSKLSDSNLHFSSIESQLAITLPFRSPRLTAYLHTALASACLHWDHFDKARDLAQLALSYWQTQARPAAKAAERCEIEYQCGQAAHLLSMAFRMLCDDDMADVNLEMAQFHFSKTPYIWQHSAMPYEIAISCYHSGQMDRALTWLDISLNEALEFDDDLRYQRIYHMKGMILLWDCNAFDAARWSLNRALEIAQNYDGLRDEVHTRHTLAFLTAREGDWDTARRECDYGLLLCEKIKHERVRHAMMTLYYELLEMMEMHHPMLDC